jgi:hypothetical protein
MVAMVDGLTDEDVVALLRFAFGRYPHHLATSAVVAAAATRRVDDALLDAATEHGAEHWRHMLPTNSDDAQCIEQFGWQAVRHDPALVASLILYRPVPITISTVRALDAITHGAESSIDQEAAKHARRCLLHMAVRVRTFAATASDLRAIEDWDPVALEVLCWPKERFGSWTLVRDGCEWLISAIDRSAHRPWGAPQIDAALRMLEKLIEISRGQALQRLTSNIVTLLGEASLETAVSNLGLRTSDPEIRSAALARARAVSTNPGDDATRYLRGWVDRLPTPTYRYRRSRGELGVFEQIPHEHDNQPLFSAEELAWLSAADPDQRVAVCLDIVQRGYDHSQVRELLDEACAGRLERALLERFEASPSASVVAWRAELGTEAAIDTLVRALARDAREADGCERALSSAPLAVPALLGACSSTDRTLALRATRALAAIGAPSSRSHFEDLVVHAVGPVRWVALLGLRRMGQDRHTCEVIRGVIATATLPEQRVMLETIAACAATPEDVSWLLEQPLLARFEDNPLDRFAWLAEASAHNISVAWLDHVLELVRENPRRLWGLRWEQQRAIALALADHLRTRGRSSDPVTALLDDIINPRDGSAGVNVILGSASRTAGATDPATSPAPRIDASACFSVLAPECVAPAATFFIEVFVHSKAARDSIATWSSMRAARRFTAGPRRIAEGTTLDVTVSIAGLALEHASGQVHWDGDIGMLGFPCEVPADAMEPRYAGKATFSVDNLTIAETHFVVELGPITGSRRDIATDQRVIRTAFASYATPDRAGVLARIQGMQKAVPFIDIFLDVVSLRSGDHWADVIRDEIKARDVLLLFWSRAARESRYVDTEWRIALEENGLERISPVPLEDPAVAPPPPELSSLHFNDWTLAIR